MEKIVRILDQSGLQTHESEDQKTGEKRKINVVTLKLTDGNDTFLGEILGERAVTCPVYEKNRYYNVKCTMRVRNWTSDKTGERMEATTIYLDKISVM